MRQNNIPSWIASAITTVLGAASVEQVFSIILLIVGILSGLFSLAFNIYCWYKKAKEDGQITKSELEEGAKILNDGIQDLTDKLHQGDRHE